MRSAEPFAPRDDEIGRFWDALIDGGELDDRRLDVTVATTVRMIHGLDEVPGPDPQLVAKMWSDALRIVEEQAPVAVDDLAAPAIAGEKRARLLESAREVQTQLFAGAIAGALIGAFAIGLGLRLAMRLAAMMASSSTQGRLTEAGNRVGEMTLTGTLFLMVLGATLGIGGGIAYVIVRPWLPWTGWTRGLIFGSMLFALGGTSLFEHGRNPDYKSVGIAGINVCLFSLIPLLFGLAVAPVTDRVLPTLEARRQRGNRRARSVISNLRTVISLGLTALVVVVAVVSAPLLLFLIGLAALRWGIQHTIGRFDRPADLWRRPIFAVPSYAVIVVPCLVGLALTLQSIGRILS